jgi:hypothetical protein
MPAQYLKFCQYCFLPYLLKVITQHHTTFWYYGPWVTTMSLVLAGFFQAVSSVAKLTWWISHSYCLLCLLNCGSYMLSSCPPLLEAKVQAFWQCYQIYHNISKRIKCGTHNISYTGPRSLPQTEQDYLFLYYTTHDSVVEICVNNDQRVHVLFHIPLSDWQTLTVYTDTYPYSMYI